MALCVPKFPTLWFCQAFQAEFAAWAVIWLGEDLVSGLGVPVCGPLSTLTHPQRLFRTRCKGCGASSGKGQVGVQQGTSFKPLQQEGARRNSRRQSLFPTQRHAGFEAKEEKSQLLSEGLLCACCDLL